ncbi:MAG TPA: phospholipid carrier-dependent glycosyltransferase, partial [Verrucomicrobiae bacterium]|nr:phospholipid carrier-dependent glycosyltransferase [Verrucomicrobiae bacterium]
MAENPELCRPPSALSQGEADDPVTARSGAGALLSRDISAAGFKKCLILLLLTGLVIRTAFLLEHARTPSFAVPTLDQVYYDTVAKMLLAGDDLHALHGFRPLLYPIFLASCYKVGGASGADLAIVVQHLLGVGTALLVAIIGARLFRHRMSGIIAGALYLLAPVPLYFEGELLIEPAYVFLIFAAIWVHLQAAEKTGWKAALLWLSGGALMVLAAQARANIMVFLAVYPLFALWRLLEPVLSRRGNRDRPPQPSNEPGWLVPALPLAGLAGALLMAIPWGLFNLRQSDHFHLLP